VTVERRHGDYLISDDPARLDTDAIHGWLSTRSYWAEGRTRATVETSVRNSLNLGAYDASGALVGAARVVTDGATFAWLCDVFVVEAHRGAGLGAALVEAAVEHPEVRDVKRFVLATADAHDLYRKFGFTELERPERWMMRRGPTS